MVINVIFFMYSCQIKIVAEVVDFEPNGVKKGLKMLNLGKKWWKFGKI